MTDSDMQIAILSKFTDMVSIYRAFQIELLSCRFSISLNFSVSAIASLIWRYHGYPGKLHTVRLLWALHHRRLLAT